MCLGLWVVVLRLVPLLSWFDHGETVEMTLQYGKAEMEKRDLWPGLIRRCSWKCHSCTAKDSLIIIKTHMVSTVLHSVLFNFILLNYLNTYLLAKAEWSRPEGSRESSVLTTILSRVMSQNDKKYKTLCSLGPSGLGQLSQLDKSNK